MAADTRRQRRDALREWMDAHDGLVTAPQLRTLGFSKREVDGMLDRGELVRMRYGLYRGRGVRWDLRAQLQAALSEQGPNARLVLVSGLHWQGLLLRPAGLPQLGVPGDAGVRHLRHRAVYWTPYARADALMHEGLPCAAPVDALPHLAGLVRGDHATRRILRRALREAVRRDARIVEQMRDLVDTTALQGVPELRAALALLPGAEVAKSDLEEDFIAFCEIWGLPAFLTNQQIEGAERDAVRLEERVIVELDTRGYHANLIAMESDRTRRRQATVAEWRHIEVTGRDLAVAPRRLARDLAAVLRLTTWAPPPDAEVRWAAVIASARGVWLARR